MSASRFIVAAGAVVALSAGSAFATDARVRVAHASPDAPNVDILVNGGAAFTDVTFTEFTSYAALPADTYNVQVVPAGETMPVVIEADLALASNTDYTVFAVNTLSAIEPIVLEDDNSIDVDNARVRFVHASPDAPAVDIAVANGGPVLFGDVEFTEVGDYLPVGPGTYDLEARLAGTSTVVLSVPNVTLERGTVYTVAAVGFAGGGMPELGVALSIDNRATANVRAIHGSPDAPAVDILVNDAVAFSNLSFTEASEYAELPWGTYNVKVVPTGATMPVVIEADLTLEPNTTYSVAALNVLAKIAPAVIVEDNSGDLDLATVRFLHASPNAPAVDIALADGGAVLFGDVEFGETGTPIAVPAGTYDLEARLAGTDTVVLDIPGVMLEIDSVNTAFAFGLVGGAPPLQAALTVDALLCPGDVATDDTVDLHDIIRVLNEWGVCDGCGTDVDANGAVDFNDLLRVLSGWGPCR